MFICSPYRGAEEQNTELARQYARFAFDKGFLPVAPHLYFPQFLVEEREQERKIGMEIGLSLMHQCREVWVFGERISEGMGREISYAARHGIPVHYFSQSDGAYAERSKTNE